MVSPEMMGAWMMVAAALVGAVAPSVSWIWERWRAAFLTVSAGLLVGTALLHMLPHSSGLGEKQGLAVLGGFLGVLLFEAAIHTLIPHAGNPGHGEAAFHEHLHMDHDGLDAHEQHLPASAFVGFSLHGLVDGAALAAAAAAGAVWPVALALLAHHIPLSASYASLLKLGGQKRSFWPLVVASAVMPVLGLWMSRAGVGGQTGQQYISGVAAGVFLYVASHNLLPVVDLRKDKSKHLMLLLAGAAVAFATHLFGG